MVALSVSPANYIIIIIIETKICMLFVILIVT